MRRDTARLQDSRVKRQDVEEFLVFGHFEISLRLFSLFLTSHDRRNTPSHVYVYVVSLPLATTAPPPV